MQEISQRDGVMCWDFSALGRERLGSDPGSDCYSVFGVAEKDPRPWLGEFFDAFITKLSARGVGGTVLVSFHPLRYPGLCGGGRSVK